MLDRVKLLSPLRHRDYRLLASGALVSLVGDGIFFVALPLLVYSISNVPTAMAVVGTVWTASQVCLLLVGGWASDHLERRRVMIAADVVRALAIGGIGLLASRGSIELWHLWALGSLVGASNAFFNPSMSAIVPDLLPDSELPRANALMGMARPALQRTLGPALGGLAVGAVGAPGAMLLNACTFLVSAGCLAVLGGEGLHAGQRGSPERPMARTAPGRGVAEGLRFVRANSWAWAWMVGAALALLAFTGPVDMLLPFVLLNDMSLTERQAGVALSLILACGGIGSMVAATAVGQLDLPGRFLTAMYVVQALGVAALAVYGLMTAVWQAVVASVVIGACFAFADVVWVTVMQRLVPRPLLGRVAGVDWLTALGLMPLSFVIAGPLATRFGARQVLVGGAVLGSVTILGLLLLVPGARDPERGDLKRAARPPGDSGEDSLAAVPAHAPTPGGSGGAVPGTAAGTASAVPGADGAAGPGRSC